MGSQSPARARYFIHYPNGYESAYIIYAISDPEKIKACRAQVRAHRDLKVEALFGEISFFAAAVKAVAAEEVLGDPEEIERLQDRAELLDKHRDGIHEAIQQEIDQLQLELAASSGKARHVERRLQRAWLFAASAGVPGHSWLDLAPEV